MQAFLSVEKWDHPLQGVCYSECGGDQDTKHNFSIYLFCVFALEWVGWEELIVDGISHTT